MQIGVTRGRSGEGLLMYVALAMLGVVSCAMFYTQTPRYPLGKAVPKPKPTHGSARAILNPATDKRRGTLPWPARGEVVTRFGSVVDPKYNTVTKSTGIDIGTTDGSPVIAVDSGKVSFADIFMGYGRMVILDHGKRVHSIYSNLREVKVKVGDNVARGGAIALSGDTLHFEFRVGGKSVDPLDWLIPR